MAELQRAIEGAIALFEPRIKDARVKLLASREANTRKVRFMITGTLRTDPDPEQIEFDTVLQVESKRFEVGSHVPDAG